MDTEPIQGVQVRLISSGGSRNVDRTLYIGTIDEIGERFEWGDSPRSVTIELLEMDAESARIRVDRC